MKEGTVLVCGTGQAGTLVSISGNQFEVLLANGELWIGPSTQCRIPQDKEDLDSCPKEVEKIVTKTKRGKRE